ncbi:MAG TPA: hypothetical protein DF610_00185 [Sphingobacterium sp.]|nr:hypothetical protein [Sphingobacterium sp.]
MLLNRISSTKLNRQMYKIYYTNGYGVISYIRKSISNLWQIAWNPNIKKWLMRINLTCSMLLIAFMKVSLAANAQKISLSKNNAPLTEIFKDLRKQSGYDFVINKDQIKIAKPVNILVNGDDLISVLNKCFEVQPFTYSMEDKMIIVVNKKAEQVKISAPPIDVKGRLVDENGMPLVGASVGIKGTNRKAVTDDKGAFHFSNVDEKAILVISFLGFEEKELKVEPDLGNISMIVSTGKLDEVNVVSTGYQRLKQGASTGSFILIDDQQLNKQFSSNILTRMESVANGVTFDRKATPEGRITVRGLSTLSGNREPLIILDNFPYQGDLNNINPNDIESITVLKDAAASSIWGARAGNGVIVLTSKRAKSGAPFAVDFNTNGSITGKPNLFSLKQMNSSEFIDVEQMLFAQGFYTAQINNLNHPALSPVVELLNANAKGLISSQQLSERIDAYRQIDVRDEILRTNYRINDRMQYSLGIRGSAGKYGYILGLGYDRNNSELSSLSDRMTFNSRNTLKLGSRIEVDWQASYSANTISNGKAGITEIKTENNILYPYLRLSDNLGNPLPVPKAYSLSYLDGLSGFLDWNYYPLNEHQNIDADNRTKDLMGSFSVRYTIIDGLKASIQYRYEQQRNHNRVYSSPDSYLARTAVNLFTQISPSGNIYKIPKGGVLDESHTIQNAQNIRGQINYEKKLGKHNIDILAGAETSDVESVYSGNTTYGYNEDNLTFSKVDLTTPFPTSITGEQSFIVAPTLGFSSRLYRFVSTYAVGNYSFMERYILSLSARRDASNIFGVKSNDKWKPLWSAGIGWIVSKEPWYQSSKLSYLKIRGSYGYSGNVNQALTAITTILTTGTSPYTGGPVSRFDQFRNPELKWEEVRTVNIGADFSLLKERIRGSIEVYQKNARDLYGGSPTDYTGVPVSSLTRNVSSMKARGLDMQLNTFQLDGEFKWSSTINFNLYRDKVIKRNRASIAASSVVGNGDLISAIEGYPVYSIFSYRWAGLDPLTGNPRGYLGGNVSSDYSAITGTGSTINDLIYGGPAFATIFGGFGNTFSYKGLSLDVQLTYKAGHYFRPDALNYNSLYNSGVGHPEYSQRWKSPGDEVRTNVPSMVYPSISARDLLYTNSETLVERADHVRVNYLTLGFQIPQSFLKQVGIRNLLVQCGASNLGIIWRANKKGLDPDYRSTAILPSKTFTLGIKATL